MRPYSLVSNKIAIKVPFYAGTNAANADKTIQAVISYLLFRLSRLIYKKVCTIKKHQFDDLRGNKQGD